MFATQILPNIDLESTSTPESTSEVVGFLNTDNKEYKILKGENKIGRDPSVCSVVLEDFTVSKLHAVIESDGSDDTFIYDVGSTNQTKLGKKFLKPHCRYKIDDGCAIIFGNVVATFKIPSQTEGKVKSFLGTTTPPSSGENTPGFNLKNSYDIFDVATQVEAPQSTSSQKLPLNFKIFKVPKVESVLKKNEVSPGPSSSFNPSTHDQEISTKSFKSQEQYFYGVEDSDIFSLSTQFQLPEPTLLEQNKESPNEETAGEKPNDPDIILSLLNDGQDDVLCTFMSIHSPNSLKKEVKTENSTEKNFNEISVVPSKSSLVEENTVIIEPDIINKYKVMRIDTVSKEINNEKLLRGKQTENLNGAENNVSVASGSENLQCNSDLSFKGKKCSSVKFSELAEDISQSKLANKNLSQKSNESFLEITLEDTELKNEDLIMTQKFSNIQEATQSSYHISRVSPNKNDKESSATKQVQSFIKSEKNNSTDSSSIQRPSTFLVEESSDEDTEPYINLSIENYSQRSREDDFINTQVFPLETNHSEKNKKIVEESDQEDEDFIATQKLGSPKGDDKKEPETQGSSPDLLSFSYSQRDSEDVTGTQIFGREVQENKKPTESESTKSVESNCVEKNLSKSFIIESSGDETESDLEITDDKNIFETIKINFNFIKTEKNSEESNENVCNLDHHNESVVMETHDNTNYSYVFQLEEPDCITKHEVTMEGREKCTNEVLFTSREEDKEKPISAPPCTIHISDSDETDCEEIEEKNLKLPTRPVKKEFLVDVINSPFRSNDCVRSKNKNEDKTSSKNFKELEKLENMSNSSLGQVSATLNVETTLQKKLKGGRDTTSEEKKMTNEWKDQPPCKVQRIEVGIETCSFLGKRNTETIFTEKRCPEDFRCKRVRSNENLIEVVPIKKPKTSDGIKNKKMQISDKPVEGKFSKLWKVHDFAQIQPSRTRNSLPSSEAEKITHVLGNNNFNKPQNSYRKSNEDQRRKQKGEMSPSAMVEVKRFIQAGRNIHEIPPSQDIPMEPNFMENKVTRILRSARRSSGDSRFSGLYNPPNPPSKTLDNRPRRTCRSKIDSYFTRSSVNIVFTGFECESLQKIITELGGKKINDLFSADVLVTDRVRRTVKFLCAIGLGIPITSPEWLMSCKKENKFIDPWNYILKNESEENWNFDLKTSLERSKKKKLLKGYNVFGTESTKPPVKDLLSIVECCGGTPMYDRPEVWPKKTIFVTCLEDKNSWPIENLRYVKLVHYEFILSGVLRQQLDFRTYKLR